MSLLVFQKLLLIEPLAFQSVRLGRNAFYSDPRKKLYVNNLKHLLKPSSTAEKLTIYQHLPTEKPVRFTAHFGMRLPKKPKDKAYPIVRPDLDNLLKPFLDACNGILWKDDSQVVQYGEGTGKYYILNGNNPYIMIKMEIL